MRMLNIIWSTGWRSLVVGIGYVATLVASGIVGGMLGLMQPTAEGADSASLLGWSLLAGLLMGVFLGPLAARMPASRGRHILVWSCAIFLNLSSVAIEGAFFAPDLVTIPIPVLVVQQLIAALVAALLVSALFRPKGQESAPAWRLVQKPWPVWLGRFILASASYLLFYAVFGLANYHLITEPYYSSHAGGLTVPEPAMVWLVEGIRAPLIALSVIPFLGTFRARSRKQLMMTTGLLLFWVGGVVPLMFQAMALPAVLLISSGVEIFFQNFSTGIVIAWLLAATPAAEVASASD